MNKEDTEAYQKALFGSDSIHVAMNYIVQEGEGPSRNNSLILGQTTFGKKMAFGGKRTHTLVCCDVIIRPHLVVSSDFFRGMGAAGIITSAFSPECINDWIKSGDTLLLKK